MRRFLLTSLLTICALLALPAPVHAASASHTPMPSLTSVAAIPSMRAAPTPLPAPAPPVAITVTTLAFAAAAVTKKGGRKLTLKQSYLFNGMIYGPGPTDVPEDFPDLDKITGKVLWPEGSRAHRNSQRASIFATKPVVPQAPPEATTEDDEGNGTDG